MALTIVLKRVLLASVTAHARSHAGVGVSGASLAQFVEGIRDCPGASVLERSRSIIPNAKVFVPGAHCGPITFNQLAAKLLIHRFGWLRRDAYGYGSNREGDGYGHRADERTKS